MLRSSVKRAPGERKANLRLALKIAARTSMRSLGRSALIASMVALPVAGIVGVAVVYDSAMNPTVSETLATTLGETQATVLVVSAPSDTLRQDPHSFDYQDSQPPSDAPKSLAQILPAGTRILTVATSTVVADTATGSAAFDVTEGETWDPSFAGRYNVVAGHGPRSDREVMVSASLLPRLGAKLGDEVVLQAPAPSPVTIVGILDDQTIADSELRIFARTGAISEAIGKPARDAEYFLPDTVLDWPAVEELNKQGVIALSREVLLNGPPARNISGSNSNEIAVVITVALAASFAAFEVILLAGAAFTVTARQQQRTLATIASVGAPRRLLFRVLAATGVVLGAIGGFLGCAVGILGAAAFMALSDDGSATQYYGFHLPWLALLAAVAFAVLIGWLSSLAPARSASRFDIVAALRGSRKPPLPRKRTPVIGLVMIITGFTLTLVGGVLLGILLEAGRAIPYGHPLLWLPIVILVVGPIAAQLGLIMCGPLVLRLIASLSQRRGIGARLASRDAARNPSRAVPALAAIMTTVFATVVAMCLISAGEENSRQEHHYETALGQVVVALRTVELSDDGTVSVRQVTDSRGVAELLRTALPVDEVRVLFNVPDPWDSGTGADTPNGIAVPMVPVENLCPSSPASPDYSPEVEDGQSAAFIATYTDWRCQSYYTAMTGATGGHLYVGDDRDLALVLDREPSAEALRTLANGGAVSLHREYVANDEFTVSWWPQSQASETTYGGQEGEALRSETLQAVVEEPAHSYNFGVFVSRETADRIGLDYSPAAVVASTKVVPTTALMDAVDKSLNDTYGTARSSVYASLESGPPQYATLWSWGLLALSGIITIASAAVAIGLARFDGRQDDATLASLGAGRTLRRRFAFWQALIITGFGTIVGAIIGLVPALALSANPHMPFVPPWLQIGLMVVALPAVIALGSWLLSTSSRVSARRLSVG